MFVSVAVPQRYAPFLEAELKRALQHVQDDAMLRAVAPHSPYCAVPECLIDANASQGAMHVVVGIPTAGLMEFVAIPSRRAP